MKLYVFEDAALADELRKGGIAVLRTNHAGKGMFAVLDTPENTELLTTNFADRQIVKTDIVCF